MPLRKRDDYFDNLRGFLIICVVLGNSLESITMRYDYHYIILCLYMFHMPMITFISGYFSVISRRSTKEKVSDTIKIYILSQIGYFIFNKYILGQDYITFDILYPSWTLWYLLSLSLFYVLSDYIKKSKKYILIAAAISLIAGFDSSIGSTASISRTLFFFPFFVGGMCFNKEQFLDKIKKYRIYVVLSFIIMLILLFMFRRFIDVEYLFEYMNYKMYLDRPFFGLTIRTVHYICAFIFLVFFLSFFPSKKIFTAGPGRNSLIIYIIHSGMLTLSTYIPFFKFDSNINIFISEIILIVCIVITAELINRILKLIKIKLSQKTKI